MHGLTDVFNRRHQALLCCAAMRRVLIAAVSACVVPLAAFAFADGPKPATPNVGDARADTNQPTLNMSMQLRADIKIAPDPPPLIERKQWVFDLRWDRGDVFLVGVHPLDLGAPQATPRAMGRFAIELYEGPTLIERARFDFPLLVSPETDGSVDPISAKLKTRIGVLFPATKRGTKLELWDRGTNQRWSLPWPPPEADAGVIRDGGTEQ
jgi:hypothetical protein